MAHVIGENQNSAQSALNELYVKGVNEASKPAMDQFLDVQTLSERLAEVDTITEEFLDDQKRWCRGRFVVANRDRDGVPTRVLWMVESIDEEKKHRDKLKRLSETDRMTGLLNRATGESRIDELLEGGDGGMLLMIDADRFKSINDGYGHDVGDKVIIAIAQALKDAFRRSDIVMRLGGDEFVAYTPEVVSEGQGRIIVNRLFNNLEHSAVKEMGGHHVYVSVGAAICKAGEIVSFAELYKRADTCTYESKKKTGNVCTFYKGE
jgi:diguanylate cyclase (GGDEF)-like protein